MIKAPVIDTKKPNIFSPVEPSFWSPKPNIFLVITLASKMHITPIVAIISPIIIKITFSIINLIPFARHKLGWERIKFWQ